MEVSRLSENSPLLPPSKENASSQAKSQAKIEPKSAKDDAALVTLSPEAIATEPQTPEASTPPSPQASTAATTATEPSAEEAQAEAEEKAREAAEAEVIRELKARDREVRQHEQAHLSAAGPYATGGPTYQFTTGPDGKQYAVGGSVGVSLSPEGTPEETIRKMQTVRRAALAPAEPSGADRQVAAQASQIEAQARQELATERREEIQAKQDNAKEADSDSVDSSAVDSRSVERSKASETQNEQSKEEPAGLNTESIRGKQQSREKEARKSISVVA